MMAHRRRWLCRRAPALVSILLSTVLAEGAVCDSIAVYEGERVRFTQHGSRQLEATVTSSALDHLVVSYDMPMGTAANADTDTLWIQMLDSLEVLRGHDMSGMKGLLGGAIVGTLVGFVVSVAVYKADDHPGEWGSWGIVAVPIGMLAGGFGGVAYAATRGSTWEPVQLPRQ